MADFPIRASKHRNELVVLLQLPGAGIDIDHLDGKVELAAQCLQRGEHVLAEMTASPSVEGQDRLTYPASP